MSEKAEITPPVPEDNGQDKRIRIATSIPSLKNKIQLNLEGNLEVIYWYIKFNIPLDPVTITNKTMGVTDTSGYIMRTDIEYNIDRNLIVVSPLDTYEENRYYLLRISRTVRSAKGQQLRSQINILFKILDNQISDYKVLRDNVRIPTAKSRPSNYDELYTRSKVYSFQGKEMESITQNKLPIADVNINFYGALAGIIITFGSFFVGNMIFTVISVAIACMGLAHIFQQMNKGPTRSLRIYNKGAKKFNQENYIGAKELFEKARLFDDSNEYADYAMYKVDFYLNNQKFFKEEPKKAGQKKNGK